MFGGKKLSAAELIEQHFPSVQHVMCRTHVLPHLPPRAWAALTSTAGSYQLSKNQPGRYITMWTLWLSGGEETLEFTVEVCKEQQVDGVTGTFLKARYGCINQIWIKRTNSMLSKLYFMIYLESLVGSEAHFSKHDDTDVHFFFKNLCLRN